MLFKSRQDDEQHFVEAVSAATQSANLSVRARVHNRLWRARTFLFSAPGV
jgi:hypothetical protein